MDYQKQIQEIINSVMEEKSFSLEVIDKIKVLKDSIPELEEEIGELKSEIDSLKHTKDEFRKENQKYRLENDKLKNKITKASELINSQKEKIERNQEYRANEIKEMFMALVKNPIIKKSSYGSVPAGVDSHGYVQHGSTKEDEAIEIE